MAPSIPIWLYRSLNVLKLYKVLNPNKLEFEITKCFNEELNWSARSPTVTWTLFSSNDSSYRTLSCLKNYYVRNFGPSNESKTIDFNSFNFWVTCNIYESFLPLILQRTSYIYLKLCYVKISSKASYLWGTKKERSHP